MYAGRGFVLGVCATVLAYVSYKAVDERLNRIERAAQARAPQTIGPLPGPSSEEGMRAMRKKWAVELAEDLRGEGLVIVEDKAA